MGDRPLSPLSLSLSFSPSDEEAAGPTITTNARPPPSIRGRIVPALRTTNRATRAATVQASTCSLSSFLDDIDIDVTTSDHEDGIDNGNLLAEAEGGAGGDEHKSKRRKIRSRASRIARPKDSMPNARFRASKSAAFYRGRGRGGGGSFRGGGRFNSHSSKSYGGCVGAVPTLDRSNLVTSYDFEHAGNNRKGGKSTVIGNEHEVTDENMILQMNEVEAPLCIKHGERCILLCCKNGKNIGRYFYKCPLPKVKQCNYFKWVDDYLSSMSDSAASSLSDSYSFCSIDWKTSPSLITTNTTGEEKEDDVEKGEKGEKEEKVKDLNNVLLTQFGFSSFRPGQLQSAQKLLDNQSVLTVLPTAGGKSLIYQLVACMTEGIVIVIIPLISLIQNAQKQTPTCLKTAAFHSGLSFDQVKQTARDVRQGNIKVLFVSPERLFTASFQSLMQPDAKGNGPYVSLVVIDEAHCVSQWGHNFRSAYLRLPRILFGSDTEDDTQDCIATSTNTDSDDENEKKIENTKQPLFGKRIRILALTATATKDTQLDICKRFCINAEDNIVEVNNRRNNLFLTLSTVPNGLDSKAQELIRRLNSAPFSTILGIDDAVNDDESKQKSLKSNDDKSDAADEHDDEEEEEEEEEERRKLKRKRKRQDEEDKDMKISWGSSLHMKKNKNESSKKGKGKRRGASIIIYVSKQKDCESIKNYLSSSSMISKFNQVSRNNIVACYHGGMSSHDRSRIQMAFEKNQIPILVATIAFGLGIHCSNVQAVIHLDFPISLESYVQEIGRAGRNDKSDGNETKMNYGHIIYNDFDIKKSLSKMHIDVIDFNCIKSILKSLFNSKFQYTNLLESSNNDNDNNNNKTKQNSKYIMYLREDELNKMHDVKFEIGETIISLLESYDKNIHIEASGHMKFNIKFFVDSPTSLIESNSKQSNALDELDKTVLKLILKHSKCSNGQYTFILSQAKITESQIASSLRKLQNSGILSFESSDKCLTISCGSSHDFADGLRDISMSIWNEMNRTNDTKIKKTKKLVQIFKRADHMMSDELQSNFLHDQINEYFSSTLNEEEEEGGGEGEGEGEEGSLNEEQIQMVENGVNYVYDDESCGREVARTGRQIAKVLHGLDGAKLKARQWWKCKMWGRFIDIDFGQIRQIANEIIRKRHLVRPK